MNPKGKVDYLDLDDYCLHARGPKQLGVQEGYFSEEMEQYLCRQIEQPFSILVADVNAFLVENSEAVVISDAVELACMRYISAAYYRSEHAYSAFLAGSYTAILYDTQSNHDDLVFFSTQNNNGVFPGLEKHHMIVLVNRTERLFVVPRNCFYSISSQGKPCYVAPVSPVCAIGLIPEEYPSTRDQRLWVIDNPDDIWRMNVQALRFEYLFNKKFVASYRIAELEQLKTWLAGNLEKLECDRTSLHKQLQTASEEVDESQNNS